MKNTLFLLSLCAFLAVSAVSKGSGFEVQFPRERILEMLSNQDVYWSGDYSGLAPCLSPNAEAVLSKKDSATKTLLLGWLNDPNRFVIAHVLLTLSSEEVRYRVSGSEWNTLRVKVSEDGRAQYDLRQMKSLQQMWTQQSQRRRADK